MANFAKISSRTRITQKEMKKIDPQFFQFYLKMRLKTGCTFTEFLNEFYYTNSKF